MVRAYCSVTVPGFLCVVLLNTGCTTSPPIKNEHTLATPCDNCVEGVKNFSEVVTDDRGKVILMRGARPSPEGFKKLITQEKVKTIVNLEHDHDDFEWLKGLKGKEVKYLWLPSRAWRPEEQDLIIFLKAVEDEQNRPVFVHCKAGKDRTGYAVATYRIVNQNWSPGKAIQEMDVFGHDPDNLLLSDDQIFLQKLVGERLQEVRERVKMAP